ncbi:MAG: alpha/beta hydrolase [Bordetella sp.]|uniref:alpha/beta hydrolase n=1 Tax=Bordetella sp. TaxID=28081 RepID=UPI003F7C59DD
MNTVPALFHQEGGPHAVLLLHGLSSSPLEMRYLAKFLRAQGFSVSVPVLNGYSAGTPERPMHDWVDAAVLEYDRLAQSHAHVSVCGLSIGAALALALAHRRPNLRALVLLSLTLSYDGWAVPWYRFLLHLAYYTPLRRAWRYRESEPYGLRNEALRAKVRRAMERGELSEAGPATLSLTALREARRLADSVRAHLTSIKNDCLIVHAIDDETSHPRNAQYVAGRLGSGFLRTIWLDDSYHIITSDNEREVVAQSTASFLRASEAIGRGDDPAGLVVSKALARRLRHLSSLVGASRQA